MAYKGAAVSQEALAIILMLIAIGIIMVVYLLLNGYFASFIGQNINSEVKLCETFQKVPIFGTIRC